jgi:four helix bundle protein
MLTFQRLDVYQRALEFLALANEVYESLPRGHAERGDQLINSAESVVRNIGEGAGRWSRADAAKHYKIARGEAKECAASLDVLKMRKLVMTRRTIGEPASGESGRHAHEDVGRLKASNDAMCVNEDVDTTASTSHDHVLVADATTSTSTSTSTSDD